MFVRINEVARMEDRMQCRGCAEDIDPALSSIQTSVAQLGDGGAIVCECVMLCVCVRV